ncbi:putative RNA methyltransferase [Litoribrevibacter euphylliae]|uniref:RNA methyltransferase n=1 Tax=Litoribrevibacter euphylliae TaxID=1834034 RepID=A0ABV7H706_9GAMM
MLSTSLQCPICSHPLSMTSKQLHCDNNHTFDQAKQGYFNLLMSNQKRSKQPGDNNEMVLARQKFLNTNIYQPISEHLNQVCNQLLDTKKNSITKILDLGCGEGYYTDRLYSSLKPPIDNNIELIGLDISKDAIRHAAKRNKDITWLVASGADIPVTPRSQDLITCLFTRLMPEGIAQALSHDGRLITVTTGKNHLLEMRDILYPSVKDQTLDPAASLDSHFKLTDQHACQHQHTLSSREQIQDLLAMTPHQWRAPAEGRDKLLSLNELTITIDVNVSLFRLN